MKTYKAKRKGLINYLFAGVIILPVAISFFARDIVIENPFVLLPLLTPLVLIVWIYFGTFYKIAESKLIYRSGFLRGNIDIMTIREVVKAKTMWSGMKPALARKGLIIKFNRYDEVYIAPEDNDEIIADLLKVNAEIKVVRDI